MTEYKESVLEFLKNNLDGLLTCYIDGSNEICIKTDEIKDFLQQCGIVQESLSLASPDFKGLPEKVIVKMHNNVTNGIIILKPNLG